MAAGTAGCFDTLVAETACFCAATAGSAVLLFSVAAGAASLVSLAAGTADVFLAAEGSWAWTVDFGCGTDLELPDPIVWLQAGERQQ